MSHTQGRAGGGSRGNRLLTATGAASVRKTSTFRIPNGHTRPRKLFALVAEAIGRVAFREKMDCWAHAPHTAAALERLAAEQPLLRAKAESKKKKPPEGGF